MIITIRREASNEERAHLLLLLCHIIGNQHPLQIMTIDEREVIALNAYTMDDRAQVVLREQSAVEHVQRIKTPYKLVSRAFKPQSSSIVIGTHHDCEQVTIGGEMAQPVIMAGPCAVENREHLITTARAVKESGAQMLWGGAFKSRTSPYQFQGLGIEGLHLLDEARQITGLPVITEVMEPDMVEVTAQYTDILQIGPHNVQNFPLLQAVGRNRKKVPVLLKRGLASTIDEWLQAAEYIVAAGNPNIILCECGIRSYDPQTRNLLDLTSVSLLHQLTHLPVIVDPSHATGRLDLVPIMSRASITAEADGLIIEVHPDPNSALCDGKQSITPEQLKKIVKETHVLASLMVEERL